MKNLRNPLILVLFLLLYNSNNLLAQAPDGKDLVDQLCGCFTVTFQYAETFSPDPDYKHHDREEIDGGYEWIVPVESTPGNITMQHLLVINDSVIIKHWHEEWRYENQEIWQYTADRTWKKNILSPESVKGKWTQSVWEVSNEPRYQGVSEWVRTNGQSFWLNTTDAPLPRREYSVRNDYNILRRTNKIMITDYGYLHEQDNQKIVRNNGKDKLLVNEKGINRYVRVPVEKCEAGKKYWEKNGAYWTEVRSQWRKLLSEKNEVHIAFKLEDKMLHTYLYQLLGEYNSGKVQQQEVNQRIAYYLNAFMNGTFAKNK